MSAFSPGIERARKAGYTVSVKPYPEGVAGIRLSLSTIAQKIRDGRLDPDIRGWVGDTLVAAGKPVSTTDKVTAILNAFRASTVYVADPVGAEYIVAAKTTICLRPGLCVRARDCDDGVVFMGSALMSVGIPARVLKQNFGPGKQEHVLVEALVGGDWVPVDPSTSLPVGESVPAVSEERVDPMDMTGTSSGTSGAEIVTLGMIPEEPQRAILEPTERHLRRSSDGTWTERRWGQWWRFETGVGWAPVGAGDACCASCAEGKPCEGGAAAAPAPVGLSDEHGDEAGCSACEAYAKKLRASGDLKKYGLSGIHKAHHRGLGQNENPPTPVSTTVTVNAPPVTGIGPNVGVAAVVGVAALFAVAAGAAWGLSQRQCTAPLSPSKRRAA